MAMVGVFVSFCSLAAASKEKSLCIEMYTKAKYSLRRLKSLNIIYHDGCGPVPYVNLDIGNFAF